MSVKRMKEFRCYPATRDDRTGTVEGACPHCGREALIPSGISISSHNSPKVRGWLWRTLGVGTKVIFAALSFLGLGGVATVLVITAAMWGWHFVSSNLPLP